MYMIEKAKSEVAAKFIASLLKKMGQKYPDLIPAPQPTLVLPTGDLRKKGSDMAKNGPADRAALEQLEQANRSLHRQVEEYKQTTEQLRQ
jgi:hypothetical protein